MSTKQKSELLTIVQQMKAEGETWEAVAKYLNKNSIKTISGKSWSGAYARRFYLENTTAKTVKAVPTQTGPATQTAPETLLVRAVLTTKSLTDTEALIALRSILKTA